LGPVFRGFEGFPGFINFMLFIEKFFIFVRKFYKFFSLLSKFCSILTSFFRVPFEGSFLEGSGAGTRFIVSKKTINNLYYTII
jgi:hypothetical protein